MTCPSVWKATVSEARRLPKASLTVALAVVVEAPSEGSVAAPRLIVIVAAGPGISASAALAVIVLSVAVMVSLSALVPAVIVAE